MALLACGIVNHFPLACRACFLALLEARWASHCCFVRGLDDRCFRLKKRKAGSRALGVDGA